MARYQLVWADEFDVSGRPNPRNWTFEQGFIRNQELQWYQPENAWCENSLLILEARRERRLNPNHQSGSSNWVENRPYADYTSASLTTQGLHDWRYGRFEMRGRLDGRAGLWPAFWTLGIQGEWPACGEIDIMEYFRGMLMANAYWGSGVRWSPIGCVVKRALSQFSEPEWMSNFHVWRLDWTRQELKLYVDDQLLNRVYLKGTVNQDSGRKNPFHSPHYLILNLAVGGPAGGDPSMTEFPARLEVDYVRVYQ
jgi:beta-glucanase (GH16 family)